MNALNAKDYLPFVQALVNKKVVQLCGLNGTWTDLSHVTFDLPPECYRIKPEPRKPRERWVNVYSTPLTRTEIPYRTKESADLECNFRLECVHYKEVIDES